MRHCNRENVDVGLLANADEHSVRPHAQCAGKGLPMPTLTTDDGVKLYYE